MLQDIQEKTDHQHYALAEQGKAWAVVLREEFNVPFAFFDAATGALVWNLDPETDQPALVELEAASVTELAHDGRARVTSLPDNRFRLSLLLYASRKPVLVAAGEISLSGGSETRSTATSERQGAMLQRWLQAVSDRLRLEDQLLSRRHVEETQNAKATTAWEALLALDQLARRLRMHKELTKNQKGVLESAFALLPVQALLWIPSQPDQPVLFQGEPPLTLDECAHLAKALSQKPEHEASVPLFCNEVSTTAWGARFTRIHNLMAFHATDQGPLGWFVAVNKKGSGPFRRSDAALLLPFVALLELHLRWNQRYQDLKDLLAGLTRSLTTALDAKDAYTFGHSERVARVGVELGRELGLEGDELGDIYLAGLLHDVGKIGIQDTVLHKPGALTPEELEHVQQHVTIGYWILAELRQIRNLLPGVLHHHERYDGAGYPDGLSGETIPLLARILAVADAYDAMSHPRPYRDAIPYRRVEEILAQGAGSQWDKRVVDAFFRCRQRIHTIRQRGVGDSLRQAIDGALRSGSRSMREKPRLQPLAGPLPENHSPSDAK